MKEKFEEQHPYFNTAGFNYFFPCPDWWSWEIAEMRKDDLNGVLIQGASTGGGRPTRWIVATSGK